MTRELHPEARAFLDRLEGANLPPIPRSLSPRSLRDLDLGDDVEPEPVGQVRDYAIDGPGGDLPIRVYHPDGEAARALVWCHGGGFISGGIDLADPLCRVIANHTDSIVVSVGYRLAPEHPFPAAIEDCFAATEWTVEHVGHLGGDPDRVAVGGTSAGANMAAAVALMARDRTASYATDNGPDLAYQWLVYPPTSARASFPSHQENATGYRVELADMHWVREQYFDSSTDRFHPYANPLEARTLEGLPPATVVTAGFDPLRDEGQAYAERLAEAGVAVEHRHYDGMIHGFFRWVDQPHARAAIEAVGDDFVRAV